MRKLLSLLVFITILTGGIVACDDNDDGDTQTDTPEVKVSTFTPDPNRNTNNTSDADNGDDTETDNELNTVDAGIRTPSVQENRLLEAPSFVDELMMPMSPMSIQLADFTLPASTESGEFTLSEYQGTILLVYFGYTFCPDICPTTLAELAQVYRELGEPDDLQVVFISVDPERDPLEKATIYSHAFHEDFIGISTGEMNAELEYVMEQFGAVANRRDVEGAAGYLVDHTASVFLVDRQGRLLGRFSRNTPISNYVHDLAIILDNQE